LGEICIFMGREVFIFMGGTFFRGEVGLTFKRLVPPSYPVRSLSQNRFVQRQIFLVEFGPVSEHIDLFSRFALTAQNKAPSQDDPDEDCKSVEVQGSDGKR